MLRHLAATLFALIGDLSVNRVQVCVLGACALAALAYWLALPLELPLWPAAIFVVTGLVVGMLWESRRRNGTHL